MKYQIMLRLLTIFLLLASCYEESLISAGQGLEDWTNASHSGSANPDYETVFPISKVNKFTVTISPSNWSAMQSNLSSIYGSSGSRPGTSFPEETPEYYPCELEFNGLSWYNVGIRYKGNSSLQVSSQGEQKLPFRFDFDHFEDDYPEINNQTFYGFPALSMSSNFNDRSLLREHTANYLFAESGVPAPSAAFYEMYLDYGEGPIYFGLYTAVEVVFETMLSKEFASDHGNCYKPEDIGAQFTAIGFNLGDFENKTTGGIGESDITELHDILHSSNRTSNEELWKNEFESIFDVDGFLKWLAVNTTIQNWDTYGRMSHNYYLYHDPADDLIKWIPWDNNEAFENGKRGGALDFEFETLSGIEWPLIDLLMDIEEYQTIYKAHIVDFIEGPFETQKMINYYEDISAMIAPSVEAESRDYSYLSSFSDFSNAVNTLKSHASARKEIAEAFAK